MFPEISQRAKLIKRGLLQRRIFLLFLLLKSNGDWPCGDAE
jgi:hypothetical protein